MPDVFLGEFNTDVLPPTVVNRVPAPGAVLVVESSDVSFDVLDDSGVDTSSMNVDFNNTPVVVAGVAQSGFALSVSAVAGGVHVVINPDSDFPAVTTILVDLTVSDLAPISNELVSSWSFGTGDTVSPVITDRLPVPGSTNVLVSSTFSFKILDEGGSGIDLTSLDVTLTNDVFVSQALVNGLLQSGFTASIVPVSGGYQVTLDVIGNMLFANNYVVDVYVQDVSGNSASSSWSFFTDPGIVETPVLTASGLSSSVACSWYVNPAMSVLYYQLRRSTSSFPATDADGQLVYQGPSRSFVDQAVINDVLYYYTVFVVRYLDGDVPVYVPYDPRSSDDALPRLTPVSEKRDAEYVPDPGEFGDSVALPWGHGRLSRVWGYPVGGGLRADHDVWVLTRGREVVAPVSGAVSDVGIHSLSLDTASGIRVQIYGQILPSRSVGDRVETGELVASALGGEAVLQISKLPTGAYGRRSIRPSYLYLRAERRL